jgi:hypothetical protein
LRHPNGHQLKAACQWLVTQQELTTDLFIEYLRSQRLATNVDLGFMSSFAVSRILKARSDDYCWVCGMDYTPVRRRFSLSPS